MNYFERSALYCVKIMKKIVFCLISVLILASFAGCKKETGNEKKEVDINTALSEIEKVNPVEEARSIDDFSLENELNIDPTLIQEYTGKVTNVQNDCAFIFICKTEKTGTVKEALNAYKKSLAGNNLYAEFADKTANAEKAIVTVKGDCVIMVIAGISSDYSKIQETIDAVF